MCQLAMMSLCRWHCPSLPVCWWLFYGGWPVLVPTLMLRNLAWVCVRASMPMTLTPTSLSSFLFTSRSHSSAGTVFKDLIPSYRIRSLTEKEKEAKVSNEVASLQSFEQALLKNYQMYLQRLYVPCSYHTSTARPPRSTPSFNVLRCCQICIFNKTQHVLCLLYFGLFC